MSAFSYKNLDLECFFGVKNMKWRLFWCQSLCGWCKKKTNMRYADRPYPPSPLAETGNMVLFRTSKVLLSPSTGIAITIINCHQWKKCRFRCEVQCGNFQACSLFLGSILSGCRRAREEGGTRRENGGTHASSCPFVLIHMSAIVSMLAASMLAGAIAIVQYGTVQNCMISTHWFKSQD